MEYQQRKQLFLTQIYLILGAGKKVGAQNWRQIWWWMWGVVDATSLSFQWVAMILSNCVCTDQGLLNTQTLA